MAKSSRKNEKKSALKTSETSVKPEAIKKESEAKIDLKKNDEMTDERLQAFAEVLQAEEAKEKVDMTTMTRKKSKRMPWGKIAFFGILTLVVIAAVAGFFYFNATQRFTGEKVSVQIEVPEQVSSGGEVTLTFSLENGEAVRLNEAELNLQYPDGFTYVSSTVDPSNDAKNSFAVGDMPSGYARRVSVTGRLVGDVGSERTITAILSYVPATFNSEFVTQESAALTIAESNLGLQFDGPSRVLPDTEVEYELLVRNNADEDMSARLMLETPDGFTLQTADPAVETGQTWTFTDLSPDEEKRVLVKGKFTGATGELRELIARVGVLSDTGSFQLQTEQRVIVQLVLPELSVAMMINGSQDDRAAGFGDTLQYELRYGNQTDEVVRDLELRLELEGDLVQWDSVVEPHAAVRDGNALVWKKEQLEDLAELRPGKSGEFTVTLQLVDALDSESNVTNPQLVSRTSIKGQADELGANQVQATTEPVTLKISSQAILTAEARYYTADFEKLGDGPLPPQVGETTTYRLFWKVQNSVNELGEVTVSATVPSNVFWTGRNITTSFGNITFDPGDRTVRWLLSRIPAGVGYSSEALTASFEVAITPTSSDLGKSMVLLDASKLQGIDRFTNDPIEASDDALTTNLDTDQYAEGRGVVTQSSDESDE